MTRAAAVMMGVIGKSVVGAAIAVSLAACSVSVNDDVVVAAGEERGQGVSTVNGAITIGSGARVDGSLRTVNGQVEIGEDASVKGVATVNGRVEVARGANLRDLNVINGGARLDADVTVDGSVLIVNGGLEMGPGGSIADDLESVTGGLVLRGVEVGGDVIVAAGTVELLRGTNVRGAVRLDTGDRVVVVGDEDEELPSVVIGAGVVVEGGVAFERSGLLWIHEQARVEGAIEGVEPRSFSGELPPQY
jgi:acetyltransferase-like isoleucine patch superfamily enzyme